MRKLSLSLRTLLSFVRILPAQDCFRQGALEYRVRAGKRAGSHA